MAAPKPSSGAADAGRAAHGRPIACIDLNGVLDAYAGWVDASHFDPPRRGARAFLEALHSRGFRVVVFTTRYAADVWGWLHQHALADLVEDVTDRKPAAFVFVDDRAICFTGDFERTIAEIDRFAAHWEADGDSSPDSTRHD